MRHFFWLVLAFILAACQPPSKISSFNIIEGEFLHYFQSDAGTPAEILTEAGIPHFPEDKILLNGAVIPADFSLPKGGIYNIQVRHAHKLTLVTPDGETTIETTADTVGQALEQTGLQLFAADFIEPPLNTAIKTDIKVSYRPAIDLTIRVDNIIVKIKSSRQTVGQAIAVAGIALLGLDYSVPPESEPLPPDGQIKVVRVSETVTLVEKSIPYSKIFDYSTNLAVGEQKVLQAGEPGLALSRERIRYEDGQEAARTIEAETVVRQPKESIVSVGTQVKVQTIGVPGGQIQYWRAVQMYATSYSPCRLGISKCSTTTASGIPLTHGVVAMVRSLFNQLSGSQVYVPGYGVAVIADIGGGFPDGRLWIDLGYSDNDYKAWSSVVTVYFLVPAPAVIPDLLQ